MMKVVGFFFKSSYKKILIAALAGLVSAALNLASLNLLNELISNQKYNPFLILSIVALCIIGSATVTYYVGKFITRHFEYKVASYRHELTHRIKKSEYRNIEKVLDRLTTILMFEVNTVGSFGKHIPQAIVSIFQLLAILIYLMTISFKLTFLIFLVLLIIILINAWMLPKLLSLEGKLSKTRFRMHFSLDRFEKGFKDLVMNSEHAAHYIDFDIDKSSKDTAALNVLLQSQKVKIDKVIEAIAVIGFGCILVFALHYQGVSKEQLLQYLTFLIFIIPAAISISTFFKQVKNVENSLNQIEAFDIKLQIKENNDHQPFSTNVERAISFIQLKGVRFAYQEGSNFQMGPLDLTIPENQITIINGGNGSGKTTLLKLITGLYTPKLGEVYYKGEPVSSLNLPYYRDQFACYFSDSPVFNTIRYIHDFNKEKYRDLMHQFKLDSLDQLQDIDQLIATKLSSGQRGRLSLIRLMMENKPIYFLDEWASHQDVEFKQKFYREFIPKLKEEGKTIILISHDDQYYDVADRLITISNGKLIGVDE